MQLIGVPPRETVLCRYGASRLLVRGPKRALDQPYVAFLGGAETFAKEIARPFPAVLERELGVTCVNLAAVCAGPDAYMGDPALLAVAAGARVKVVQLSGAHMLSNRFYSVHPRRNDRFVKASAQMRQQFAGVDFTDFAFVGHMVGQSAQDNPAGFALLRTELETAWQARMRRLLEVLGPPVVLLWVERPPRWRLPQRGLERPAIHHAHAAGPGVAPCGRVGAYQPRAARGARAAGSARPSPDCRGAFAKPAAPHASSGHIKRPAKLRAFQSVLSGRA